MTVTDVAQAVEAKGHHTAARPRATGSAGNPIVTWGDFFANEGQPRFAGVEHGRIRPVDVRRANT